MQSDSVYQKYRDEVIILLGTGLRISELCGLTETDLDFENRVINVDHQLLWSAETGYYKKKSKMQSGIRQIPMNEKMCEALGRMLENCKGMKQIMIDGYSNFLFRGRDGCPKTNVNYATMFRRLAKKCNKCHEEALLKVMTFHTLRHLYVKPAPKVETILVEKDRLYQSGCQGQYCKAPDIVAWLLAVYPLFHIILPALFEDANF